MAYAAQAQFPTMLELPGFEPRTARTASGPRKKATLAVYKSANTATATDATDPIDTASAELYLERERNPQAGAANPIQSIPTAVLPLTLVQRHHSYQQSLTAESASIAVNTAFMAAPARSPVADTITSVNPALVMSLPMDAGKISWFSRSAGELEQTLWGAGWLALGLLFLLAI